MIHIIKEISPVREDRVGMVLFNMALPAKVISKQRPEDSEEVSHEDILKNVNPNFSFFAKIPS